MDTRRPKFQERRRAASTRGASIVETLAALGVLSVATLGASSFISKTMPVAHQLASQGETADGASILVTYLKNIVTEEARTDPCLTSSSLATKVSDRLGPINDRATIEAFSSKEAKAFQKKVGESNLPAGWSEAVHFCASAHGNQTCVFVRKVSNGAVEQGKLALAVLGQTSVDFKTNQPTGSSCDNAKVLDAAQTAASDMGIGIRANYVLFTSATIKSDGEARYVFGKTAGSVVETAGKSLKSGGGGTFSQSPTSTCSSAIARCTSMPIPPDPGIDYAGWKAFSHKAAYDASYCGKCERAPDYR